MNRAEEIRDAATVILIRRDDGTGKSAAPRVLMGQRGAAAAFMPSKFVFPGGALDPSDSGQDDLAGLTAQCLTRLSEGGVAPGRLVAAALRELHEETGLVLRSAPQTGAQISPQAGLHTGPHTGPQTGPHTGPYPGGAPMRFVFRAITPPGRSRRFDARFFLADAAALAGDPDDFSDASDELSHLAWLGLDQARQLDLPFITEVVLAEVSNLLRGGQQPGVPFFDNSGPCPCFRRIGSA
ncbi:NUDIX hydrolase [Xinfangfangia sp. D13-10-4-6]|uniref:NUDIX hydrolase n=1 Tax=Pseudogemmobacter hezensis TaxID=2737662 RepID=UPI001553E82F|nr:NUDIX hydrolase [Pseudogemmobacter hezensis]NPD15694.1 NUDIX hydrolase [Pseudogemmobacter hezensis]